MRSKIFLAFLLILTLNSLSFFQETQTFKTGKVVPAKPISLPRPSYPPAAKAVRASGPVNVKVTIDEEGNIISAEAVSGHPLLRAAAENAARQAKFSTTYLKGEPVKVTGIIVYNFTIPFLSWRFIGNALGDAQNDIESPYNLQTASMDLASKYPEESAILGKLVAEFTRNGKPSRFHAQKMTSVINSLRKKIRLTDDYWLFELGFNVSRIKANPQNNLIIRQSLQRLKFIRDAAPASISPKSLSSLQDLSSFEKKKTFTRLEKKKILELAESL